MTSLTIGTGLKMFENFIFEGCSSLTSVTIPSNVTQIFSSVFRNCSKLASLTLSEGLTEIGNNAFQGCSSLTTLTIPNSVKTISSAAFMECSKLTKVTLGSSISSISSWSFRSCEAIENVYVYAEEVPYLNKDAFTESYPEYIKLHVPEGTVDAYSADEAWSMFKEILPMTVSKHTLTYMVDGEVYKSYEMIEVKLLRFQVQNRPHGAVSMISTLRV